MSIKINIERKFKVNGIEYNSIEEMPEDIRQAFKKAQALRSDPDHPVGPLTMQNKIVFNKTVFKSKDELPQDVRQLYEQVMKAAETGKEPLAIDLSEISISAGRKSETSGGTRPADAAQPTRFEHLLSTRTLIGFFILIALLLLLFNL
jgi:hypothetical protein